MLTFGEPGPFVPAIREADCALICQVQSVKDGRAAREAGADIIVAQGTEAGGHGADRATLPLVPAVVDAVAPTPVLAAGGIVRASGVFIGDLDQPLLGNLGQVIRPGLLGTGHSRAWRTLALPSEEGLDASIYERANSNSISGITVHEQVLVGGEKVALLGYQDFDCPTLAVRIAVYEPRGAEESFIDLDHLTAGRGAENKDEIDRLDGANLRAMSLLPSAFAPRRLAMCPSPSVSLSVVGRHRDDLGVLQLGRAFERATTCWKQRLPVADRRG